MIAHAALLARSSCPTCGGTVDVKTPHVVVAGTAVQLYCSARCLDTRNEPAIEVPTPRRRRAIGWVAGGGVLAGGAIAGGALWFALERQRIEASAPPEPQIVEHVEVPPPLDPGGDEDPRAADATVIAEIMHDTWVHPLAGPQRRMPVNHNGAFGAARDGERPPECVSGHCGVDVGNRWGEPVLAAHDGVVDFVHRGPNEEHGGIFVRLSHRGGSLYTWYFHLAAVPRAIRPGVAVTAGEVIGLLGDTGIKRSSPHLHFALSVKPAGGHERYLDPEPLIAIWPLWIASDDPGTGTGHVSFAEAPGVPVRDSSRRKRAPAKTAPAPAPAADESAAPVDDALAAKSTE